MTFEEDKKRTLAKTDKSKKGGIDEKILPLCDLINGSGNYYTTSSCSGRIVLRKVPSSGKKCETEWLFTTHDIADVSEVKQALSRLPDEQVWFGFEAVILHIICADIDAASELVKVMRDAGLKRTGIISTERIVVEVQVRDAIPERLERHALRRRFRRLFLGHLPRHAP